MELIVLGDSHVVSLSKGLIQLNEKNSIPSGVNIISQYLYPGYRVRAEFYWRDGDLLRFKGARLKNNLKVAIGTKQLSSKNRNAVFGFSSGFYHRNLIEHMLRAQILPWNICPGDTGARRISTAEMQALVKAYNQYLYQFFFDLRDLGLKFFAIAPPPPRLDDKVGRLGKIAGTHIEIDAICRKINELWFTENRIPFVLPPAEMADQTGALRQEYYEMENGDDHHANANYGEIVMKKVISTALDL